MIDADILKSAITQLEKEYANLIKKLETQQLTTLQIEGIESKAIFIMKKIAAFHDVKQKIENHERLPLSCRELQELKNSLWE